ncbi:MAG: hypothetical protein AAF296_12560 [Pseudomonadota bacterium]
MVDNSETKDQTDIANIRDLIKDGIYNDDTVPRQQVPGTGIVEREIETDDFKSRADKAREDKDEDSSVR